MNTTGILDLGDGQKFSCVLRRSERARVIRLAVKRDLSVEVVIPCCASEKDGFDFLRDHLPWLRRTLAKMRLVTRSGDGKRREVYFPEKLNLPLLGGVIPVRYEWRRVPWTAARFDKDFGAVIVTGSVLDGVSVRDAFENFLHNQARTLLPPMLAELAREHSFTYRSVSIRMQKGRWGSCSGRGTISLNAYLLGLPEDCIKFVLLHELCHLMYLNHSSAFHDLLDGVCPFAEKAEAYLRKVSPRMGLITDVNTWQGIGRGQVNRP